VTTSAGASAAFPITVVASDFGLLTTNNGSATVQYSGRSSYPGLDQINVVVPAGVSGCYVSVVVQTGNYESTFVTIPVAPSGRPRRRRSTEPGAERRKKALPVSLTITSSQLGAGASLSGSESASLNNCMVNFYNATVATTPAAPFSFNYLNAGPDINIVGPTAPLQCL
jgi:hypothetical protein